MLSNGTYPWSRFTVGSNVRLQMDRVRYSKDQDEAEVEDGGLECRQGDLEERVRVVCLAKSRRLAVCKLLPSLRKLLISQPVRRRRKTLDHRLPMS